MGTRVAPHQGYSSQKNSIAVLDEFRDNAYWEPVTFELPPMPAEGQQALRRCIDTAVDSPDDVCPWESAPVVRQASYEVQPRSVVVLARALDEGR